MLRRATGLAEPFHVAPHLTLVPPVNVAEGDLGDVGAVLRRVAASSVPLELDVGPAATFLPETPTLHLEVAGPDLDGLRAMRGHLRSGPFDRPDVWPFHPHVTIREHAESELVAAGLRAFAGFHQRWVVPSLHLLEQRRRGPEHPLHGQACWWPIREEPLGGLSIVGRGGVELALRTVTIVEPDVSGLLGLAADVDDASGERNRLVVVAESATTTGELLGAAAGRLVSGSDVGELSHLSVLPARRGEGIGARLLAAWISSAAARGAGLAAATWGRSDPVAEGFLQRHGFERVRAGWFRRL